jgi:hypothetical protein
MAGYALALGMDATNSLADAKYAQSIGKKYTIYRNGVGKFVTGFSVKY